MPHSAFHLAFPVSDLDATRSFFRDTLGCEEGRESDHWIDFNFHGHQIADRLRRKHTAFVIEPHIRFAGEIGEQATMFLRDPSGNALEFKAFRDSSQVFAR